MSAGASTRFALAAALLGALTGAFCGAVAYTAHFAKATSYFLNDPKACINCHIMNEQYDGWSSSSHHARATCNDCHVPHESLIAKYYVKAEHGYRHSKRFTFQNFHEPIRINAPSRDVVITNCIRCHETMTRDIRRAVPDRGADGPEASGGVDCIHCHASVAHGPIR